LFDGRQCNIVIYLTRQVNENDGWVNTLDNTKVRINKQVSE
jgi:hypothetical protein